MSQTLPLKIRQKIATRAGFRCEYCRVHQDDSNFLYHIEHIISKKHGGSDDIENLAFACSRCNWKKGSDLGTVLPQESEFVFIFNPRKENWFEHFEIVNGVLVAKTRTGAATIQLLQLNFPDLILERIELIAAGNFP